MAHIAKAFLILGGSNAVLVVFLGAFGAHALKTRLSGEMLAIWQTGIHYQMFHALGLLLLGLAAIHVPGSVCLKWSGWLMMLGIILFSGSLYLLSLSGLRWLGMVTPFGGTAFLVAWILFLVAIVKSP